MKLQDQVLCFDSNGKPGVRFYTAELRRRKKEAGGNWLTSACQVCAKSFKHLSKYQPATCGRFDCLWAFNTDSRFAEAKRKHEEYMRAKEGQPWKRFG